MKRAFVRLGAFFFRFRDVLFPLVLLALFLVSRPRALGEGFDGAWLRAGIGALVALSGEAFRLVVIGYAYIGRGGKNRRVHADELVVSGFFSHCRNPMYVGNLLIVGGLALLYDSWFGYAFVLPFFVVAYLAIVATEEDFLHERFGAAYQAYVERVNRFVPDPRGLKASLEGFRYDWKRVIRKDYGNVFVTLGCIVLIGTWKTYAVSDARSLTWGVVAGVAVTLFYVVARVLKKSGRLDRP